MDLRTIIVEAAQRLGFDYKKLAQQAGLPPPTVHRYVKGKLDLTGSRIGRLLSALDLVVGKSTKSYKDGVRQVRRPKTLFMTPTTVKPVLRYPDFTWRSFHDLVRLIPPHEHYVSLFGGSGADILRKPPSPIETFNDLDPDVAEFFKVLRDPEQFQRLRHKIASTPAATENAYREAHDLFHDGRGDTVDRAWALEVVSRQGFITQSPSTPTQDAWRHARKPYGITEAWLTLPKALDAAAERFRQVQISQQTWEVVLELTDSPTTMLVVDPPYELGPTPYNYHPKKMMPIDHEELVMTLTGVKGFVMLLAFDEPLYRTHLKGWRHRTLRRHGYGDGPAGFEAVWLNYDTDGKRVMKRGLSGQWQKTI